MFTEDWFSWHVKNWTQYLEPLKGQEGLTGLEIGCFEGKATVWLMQNIFTHPTSHLTVIDPFEQSAEYTKLNVCPTGYKQTFLQNIGPFQEKIHLLEGYSQQVLRWHYQLGSFDFVYIDGSHRSKETLEDAILVWPMVKSGGIVIFDDYNWDVPIPELDKPKMAIDAFLQIYQGEYELLLKDYQLIIKKITPINKV